MQIVTIKGTQCNCEAAKGKIEELVKLSVVRKAHGQIEVYMHTDVLICYYDSCLHYCNLLCVQLMMVFVVN